MVTPEQLQQIFTSIAQGNETAQNIETLNQTLESQEKISFQVGENVVNIGKIGESAGIQIGDKYIYQGSNLKTIQESFRLALQEVFVFNREPQLSPKELKKAVGEFLADIEAEFQYLKLFHAPQEKVALTDQYISIQVTLERRYQHKINESLRSYGESEEEVKNLYAMKGRLEEFQRTQVDWQKAKKEHQRIMILADPGMGKSTLLRMESVTIAEAERKKLLSFKSSLNQEIDENSESCQKEEKAILQEIEAVKFPLYLRLSDLAEEKGEIIDIILGLIKRNYPKTTKKLEFLLRDKLEKGQCFLFLDALDEVPKEKRLQLQKVLNPFIKSYNFQVICTSRIVGYSSFLDDAKEMEIVPFTEMQTREYIESWFKNAANFIEDKQVSAASLINELRSKPQIQGLTQNPLLLSLVCSLYQTKGLELPARRTQVYEKAVDYMLSRWGVQEGDKRQTLFEEGMSERNAKQKLLEAVAYYFSCQQKEVFSEEELAEQVETYLQKNQNRYDPDRVIKTLTEENGIIQKLSKEGDRYLFLHRTFQEYLTASYINRIIKKNQEEGIALVKSHVWQFDWHETISLVAGLMANPISLLKTITEAPDDIFKTLLLLAGLCISECQNNNDPLIQEIVSKIGQFWQSYPGASFIEAIVVALGKIGNEKVVEALIKTLDDSDGGVRRYAAYALGKIGNEKAVEALIKSLDDSDGGVRRYATYALGEIGDEKAVEALIKSLDDSDGGVGGYAAGALVKIGHEKAVEALIKALDDSDDEVRRNATYALGEIGGERAVEALIEALDDSDHWVRGYAAYALGKIGDEKGNKKAVETMIEALDDSDDKVRRNATYVLKEIGDEKAVEALIKSLDDSDGGVGGYAAGALVKIGHEKAVEALIEALDDSDDEVRRNATYALGEIGDEKAVEALIEALDDSDDGVRGKAASALGKIGDEKAVEALIEALDDSDDGVRRKATYALGKIGDEKAVEALIEDLDDSDHWVRGYAAEALGEIGNEKAVEALIKALDDSDHWVRGCAAEALGEIGNEKAVEALIEALDHYFYEVRYKAAEALGKIGNAETAIELMQKPDLDIYRSDIFLLTRKLAIRHNRELTHPLTRELFPQPLEEKTDISDTDVDVARKQENISTSSNKSFPKKETKKKDKKKKGNKKKKNKVNN